MLFIIIDSDIIPKEICRMRNKKPILFSMLFICILLLSVDVYAETQGDWSYTVSNKKVTVTAYTGNDTDVTIPGKIAGYPVTAIGASALKNCETVAIVNIPDSVNSIGNSAFYGCRNLVSINIPVGVKAINNRAFTYCRSLVSIDIPDGVTTIGPYAFHECSGLTSVSIPDSITTIDERAFSHCSKLNSLDLPDNISFLGDYAFIASRTKHYASIGSQTAKLLSKASYSFIDKNYNALTLRYLFDDNNNISGLRVINCDKETTSITLPVGVTSILDSAFSGCSSLTDITIPDTVASIGNYAFYNCSSLTEITIPDTVTSIGHSTFRGCSSLTDIAIPDTVTSIGNYAFFNCKKLTEIKIPDSVTSISDYAFYSCSRLTSVTIPNVVTSIENYTFCGCSSLSSVAIPDSVTSIGDSAFSNCSSLTSVTIPDSVTSIGRSAFSSCSKLTAISIPNSVTSIDDQAFYGCNRLNTVTLPNSLISIGSNSFDSVQKVYIPDSVKNFGSSPFSYSSTIYCHEFSEADYWAKEHGYKNVLYIDQLHPDQYRSISLSISDITLARGKSMTIAAQAFPNFDLPEITWDSSDQSVATVNNGTIHIVGKGTATITASVDSASATVSVTGYIAPESFDLISEEWVLTKHTLQLGITNLTPPDADISLSWRSADTGIATVDSNGLVTAKRPGEVMISVSAEAVTQSCLVHVTYPVTAISFDAELVRVLSDETLPLVAHVTAREDTFDNRMITMSSSDESIATVDEDFVVHPLKAGTVIITATAESGVSASVECNVIEPCSIHTPLFFPGRLPADGAPGYTAGSICSVCGKKLDAAVPVRSVKTLRLPPSLKGIANNAFTNCGAEYVFIPSGATAIGNRAFADSEKLRFITVPSSVIIIAPDAFEGCELLTFFCSDSSAAAAYAEAHGFAHTAP